VDWAVPHRRNLFAASSCVQAYGFDLATPFEKFPDKIQNLLLNGEPQRSGQRGKRTGFLGSSVISGRIGSFHFGTYREYLLDFMSATECSVCQASVCARRAWRSR